MSALPQGQFISINIECESHSGSQPTVSGLIISENPTTPSELFLYEELGFVRVRGFTNRLEYRVETKGDFFEIGEDFRSTALSCRYSGVPFPIEAEEFHGICAMLQ